MRRSEKATQGTTAMQQYNTDLEESVPALERIMEEMGELLERAIGMTHALAGRDSLTYNRADAYWYPQIQAALGGNSMCSMRSTINELKEMGEEEEED